MEERTYLYEKEWNLDNIIIQNIWHSLGSPSFIIFICVTIVIGICYG